LRVLLVSKILVVAAYRDKLEQIAAQSGLDQLVAVTPPAWQEPGGRRLALEPWPEPRGYELRVAPIAFNANYHLFFWPTLGRIVREVKPDLVHLDEEPYNFATAHGTWLARRAGAPSLFFTWQNLLRRYPPPFSWLERWVLSSSACAIAGSGEALQVLRTKGYRGQGAVIPQFGVDPALFAPDLDSRPGPPVIGFVGRLVEEKGILVLLQALVGVPGNWRLYVVGSGPLDRQAREQAAQLGLSERIIWEGGVASRQMPRRLRSFTILVQPSLTRRHWKEQFGRAVMEAMACGIPVVGSASAEIPNVLGAAGLVVPEGDPIALGKAIAQLLSDPALRHALGQRGRERVLACYTNTRIAQQTVQVYREVLNRDPVAGGATMGRTWR
jgi:glycosyltransferase involved in cell wall biosynthesis